MFSAAMFSDASFLQCSESLEFRRNRIMDENMEVVNHESSTLVSLASPPHEEM